MTATLTRLSNAIVLAWGWRRALIAFASGAASTLALAPFHIWPVLFFTFPTLVWLVDGSSSSRRGRVAGAAMAGWWFGFGYFLAGLYWVGIAFLVDAKTFGWLLPIAVIGLPAGLALFTALGLAGAALLWTAGPQRIFALAAALTVSEWVRGHVLSGFPWNAFGYALTSPLPLAQSAALLGLWGLTFLAVFIFASLAVLTDPPSETRRRWLLPALSLAVLAGLGVYGALRLSAHQTVFEDGVRLRIMQPNLPQDQKFNYAAKSQIMARYLALSDRATGPDTKGVRDVTHLIWPESAFPFLLTREPEAMAQVADLLPPGVVLITGAARAEQPSPGQSAPTIYNSIYALDDAANVAATYDKVHLVPFGEYLPLQSFLERLGLQQLTKVRGGFTAAIRRRLMSIPGLPLAVPLICYEIIFPAAVVPPGDAGWMLNLTNDGWFGNSTGPYQHFQQARVRAIEEGLPLVRAANTGISAVVDPVGRIVRSLPLGVEGVLDSPLPKRIDGTPYKRIGDAPAAIMVALAFVFSLRRRRR